MKRAATRACVSADSFWNLSEKGILPSVLHSMMRAQQFTVYRHNGEEITSRSHASAERGSSEGWGVCVCVCERESERETARTNLR